MRRRPRLNREVILPTQSRCDLTQNLQAKIGRTGDQHPMFLAHPAAVEPTNNGNERKPAPAVIQQKMTNGYRGM